MNLFQSALNVLLSLVNIKPSTFINILIYFIVLYCFLFASSKIILLFIYSIFISIVGHITNKFCHDEVFSDWGKI